jgi:hypothetical protein
MCNLIVDGHLETGWLFKGHLGRVAAGKDTHNKVGGSQPQLGNIGAAPIGCVVQASRFEKSGNRNY